MSSNQATRDGKYKPGRWRSPLAALIVSPERAAWIMETYPPEQMGRPGILHRELRGTKIRKTDADEGREDELTNEESEGVEVAAD
jgi:hypothetical protein